MTTPPTHPQPSFYEQLVEEQGFDPDTLAPRTHQQFMSERNQDGWLGYTLMLFDKNQLPDRGVAPKATKLPIKNVKRKGSRS